MRNQLLSICVTIAIAFTLGCRDSANPKQHAAEANQRPEIDEVTDELDVAAVSNEPVIDPRCEYDPTAPWHSLSQEELDDPKNEAVRTLVNDGTPCSVFFIGDKVRVYAQFGEWRPSTLEVLNADETVRTCVRLDAPPTGVVRIPLAVLGIDPEEEVTLRITKVLPNWGTFDESGEENEFTLVEPKIGTPSEPLSHESIRDLGFANGTKNERKRFGVQIRNEKWNSASSSSTIGLRPNKWTLYTARERSSLVATHAGNDGEPPPEAWWAREVAKHYLGKQ